MLLPPCPQEHNFSSTYTHVEHMYIIPPVGICQCSALYLRYSPNMVGCKRISHPKRGYESHHSILLSKAWVKENKARGLFHPLHIIAFFKRLLIILLHKLLQCHHKFIDDVIISLPNIVCHAGADMIG